MQGLGELEALVMDVVWNATAAVRVRDIIDQLEDGREPAYTTIQTVLDNLHRKGWVHRQRNGRAYWYEATRSREEAASDALRVLLESTGDPTSVLLHFARGASDDESKVLTRGLKERKR